MPARFFLLVFAISVPFWAIGEATRAELMPRLPVSALMAFCPAVVALGLMQREAGRRAVHAVLTSAFSPREVTRRGWYIPTLLLMPTVAMLAYGVLRIRGDSLSVPHVSAISVAALTFAFLASGLGEELGWSGYATDSLLARWGALPAALTLGLVTGAWHIVPLLQTGRAVEWIAWWALGTVAMRVLTVWLYVNTKRSVFVTALFHCTQNLCWQLFPVRGSHYDPHVFAPILVVIAGVVTVVWSPRTLANPRWSRGSATSSRSG